MEENKRVYFSQRNEKNKKLNLIKIKKIIYIIYSDFADKKYFCEKLAIQSHHDEKNLDTYLYTLLYKENLWTIFTKLGEDSDIFEEYSKEDLFDLIEFMFDHISKPISQIGDEYCGWCRDDHYSKFSADLAKKEFLIKINKHLNNFEDGYEVNENGEIVRSKDGGIKRILEAKKTSLNNDINQKMIDAEILFYKKDSSIVDRHSSIKQLADAFELIRPKVKEVLNTKDENSLFEILNNFEIRHSNYNQKNKYDKNIWLSWMFHFYLASLHAGIRLIEKQKLEQKKDNE